MSQSMFKAKKILAVFFRDFQYSFYVESSAELTAVSINSDEINVAEKPKKQTKCEETETD